MSECDMPGCVGPARPIVCEDHTIEVHSILNRLPRAYAGLRRLAAARTLGQRGSDGRPSKKAPFADPSLSISPLMEEMVAATTLWAHIALDLYQLPPLPHHHSHAAMLQDACASLLRHDDRMLRLSVAGRYVTTMNKLDQQAAAVLRQAKAAPPVHRSGHGRRPVPGAPLKDRALIVAANEADKPLAREAADQIHGPTAHRGSVVPHQRRAHPQGSTPPPNPRRA